MLSYFKTSSPAERYQSVAVEHLLIVTGLFLPLFLIIEKPILYLAVIPGMLLTAWIMTNPLIGFYCLVAAVPLDVAGGLISITTTFNISIAWVFTGLTLLGWVVHSAYLRKRPVWPPELWLWVLYLILALISLFNASEFDRGVEECARIIQNILFFWLIINMVNSHQRLKNTLVVLVVSTICTFAYAILQKFIPTHVFQERGLDLLKASAVTYGVELGKVDTQGYETVERVTGTTLHSGMLALNCAYFFPFLMCFIRLNISRLYSALGWIGVFITLGAFSSTLSRSGFLTFAFAIMLMVFTGLLQVTVFRLLVVAIGALLAIPFLPSGYIERVLSPSSYLPSNSDSLNGRLEMWSGSLHAIMDHPFSGLGVGNEHGIFVFHYWKPELKDQLGTVMNTFLQIGMEVGIFGVCQFLLFTYMVISGILRARKLYQSAGMTEMALIGTAFLVLISSCVVSWMSVEFLRAGFKNVWILLGCIVAYYRILVKDIPPLKTLETKR